MAVDIENAFFEHILLKQDLDKAIDSKVKEEFFSKHGSGRRVWRWLIGFYREYGCTPSRQAFSEKWPAIELEESGEDPLPYLINQLKDRHINTQLLAGVTEVAKQIKNKSPKKALDIWRKVLLETDEDVRSSRDVNWAEKPEERFVKYEELQKVGGVDGYPTPWNTLNEATQGMHKEDYWMVVARSSVGKTWAALIMAHHIWTMGKTPLVFTKEMSVFQIMRRLDATYFKLPYQKLRSGKLDSFAEEAWRKSMESLKEMHPFWITGDDEEGGVSGIATKVDLYRPDAVFIDGGELLLDDRKGASQWERVANVSRDLKKLARRAQVPLMCSFQLNKQASRTKGSADHIARSDIQKDADVIIGVFQSEDQKEMQEIEYRILKQREGPRDIPWLCRWDFETMEFHELDVEDKTALVYSDEEELNF